MTSTGRGGKRRKDDFYETQAYPVYQLLDHLEWLHGNPFYYYEGIIEPCAGRGAIIHAVRMWCEDHGVEPPVFLANDISALRMSACPIPKERQCIGDASAYLAEVEVPHGNLTDWLVLSNPPFSTAHEHAEAAIARGFDTIFLQKVTWGSSRPRNEFMTKQPVDLITMPNRLSFTGGSTDSTEYGWYRWEQHATVGHYTILPEFPYDVTDPDPNKQMRKKAKARKALQKRLEARIKQHDPHGIAGAV